MGNKLYIYISFFVFLFVFQAKSQTVNIEDYMRRNDLRGLICEFGGDEISVLDALSKYTLPDTITTEQMWYNTFNGLEGIFRKYNLKVYDGYIASFKLKSYYWMIKIFRMEYDVDNELVCFFSIWDYDKIKDVYPIKYVRNNKDVSKIDSLDKNVQEWVNMVKIRGLKDVRVSWNPPFLESEYRIYKPLDRLEFYRKCQKNQYKCK